MGLKKGTTLLDDLIDKAGGCAVIDGGFATQLESHGAAINDPLWSALCLIKDPDLIQRVTIIFLCLSRALRRTLDLNVSLDFETTTNVSFFNTCRFIWNTWRLGQIS